MNKPQVTLGVFSFSQKLRPQLRQLRHLHFANTKRSGFGPELLSAVLFPLRARIWRRVVDDSVTAVG
jgi:hypothetical protein